MKFSVSESSFIRCCSGHLVLAFGWFTGLVTGAFLSSLIVDCTANAIRVNIAGPASAGSLILTTFLPFLVSAIAVFLSKPVFLPLIAYCKAAVFSLVSFVTLRSFGTSGWMIRFMVMFTDIITLPLFYSFCRRHLDKDARFQVCDGAYLLALFLICGFDFSYISPFLLKVLQS